MDCVEFRHGLFLGERVSCRVPLTLANENDEKSDIETAFDHLGNVNLPVAPNTGIDFFSGKVERDVVVRVDRKSRIVDFTGPSDDVLFGRCSFFRCGRTACRYGDSPQSMKVSRAS